MLVIDKKIFMFNIKEVHFSKNPFDIEGCDFLIFPYCKNKVEAKGFVRYEKLTSIIDLTQDLDTIWQKFHHNTKRGIKQANEQGVKISINYGYEQFYKIYKKFLIKKDFNSIFKIFRTGIITLNKIKNRTLFVAEYNGEILGGRRVLEDDSTLELWIGASKRLEDEKEKSKLIGSANRLMLWEAIKYAKERGIKEFDFGGLFPEDKAENDPIKKGINSFKLSFGGDIVHGYTYEKSYSKALKVAYYLYNLKIERYPR
ncbi:MAG: GNAT family N-acetyltransferase [Candidatus Thermoplasmatota archaeon]|nr:GNAT family N-acetyltransferase [Candidatus Thermoplasmatota archaeon]